ncbi:hypothetical protein L6164_005155 [Bauhinia variegata]|uniref:Uncharacterized protein n=1 Tax=Bauhinia variegata TaxID=167791 RepID=A0ACB9PPJ2_BAUVA|nr:hypothetical protein L6164_005155 [Bauhinia variegata]
MGVHGLWELLAPVGRRVSVETLAGKKLAIDASIWMVQFMKAMRDEKGETIRNAHLLGFFRRICKLLFLRTKPVFVFDGGTPALKRRTVLARRKQREMAQAKVRKTAEKLLLNHLKALKLKELADDIKNQRLKQKTDTKGQKKSDQSYLGRTDVKELDEISGEKFASEMGKNLSRTIASRSCNQEELDEMLAASMVAEEDGTLADIGVASAAVNLPDEEVDANEDMMLPIVNAEIDPSVFAALPHSIQFDILAQYKGRKTEELVKNIDNHKHEVSDKGKGKGILSEIDMVGCSSRNDDAMISGNYNQDKVDEMLAASIVSEENGNLANSAPASVGAYTFEEEDGNFDEDEEMILPTMHGEVDPAVLASLPPSMQLDLLVQMRERLIAENRQKYQKVKKDPAKFSELQILAYLKTVSFRREIDQVQKTAAGGGEGGVQISRIASEANREYIFSSSFTGDKQELTSNRLEKDKGKQQTMQARNPSQSSVKSKAPANDSNSPSKSVSDEPEGPFDESIQTYLDERGRFRVSRLRAMGMHMTRDIQRNLDMMKEIEQERRDVSKASNINALLHVKKDKSASRISGNQLVGASHEINVDFVGKHTGNKQSVLESDTSIEISFKDDEEIKCLNDDDDFFASLVADNSSAVSKEQPSDPNSDSDWEEGIIEGKSNVFSGDIGVEMGPSVVKDDNCDESEIEWEEGVSDGAKSTLSCPVESHKVASRGCLEEEADLQEAIRRSLDSNTDGELNLKSSLDEHSDADEGKFDYALQHDDNLVGSGVNDCNDDTELLNIENGKGRSTFPREVGNERNESLYQFDDGDEKIDNVTSNNPQTSHSTGSQSKLSLPYHSDNLELPTNKPCMIDKGSHSEDLLSDANERMKNEVNMVVEQILDTRGEDGKVSTNYKSPNFNSLAATEEEKKNYNNEAEPLGISTEITSTAAPFVESSLKGSTGDLNAWSKLPRKDNDGSFVERKSDLGNGTVKAYGDLPAGVTEVILEEEMRNLDQEYINLENEHRKLERNAESVNSELFTECQELLQMFGLPYIIAPMEAEAQCAYLELAKLVDGVVTDDSDVLLFGGRSVYKNIFDDRKYVETYFVEDVEKELGLTREKLIRMALLLGSDYTEGVSGIGIVNAIEVVNAFPEEDGLLKFRRWVESPDPTILGMFDAKSGSSTNNRGSKVEENKGCSNSNTEEAASDKNISQEQEQKECSDYIQEIKQTFMDKHRNVSKNWHIPTSFPSETVISAYHSPQVDKSTEPFTWGKPDHLVLRKLCWEKFGWTSQKADELLLPVLKEYNKHETQLRLEAFYTFNERFAKIRSKRIKKAIKGITGNQTSELIDDSTEDLSKSMKTGKGSPVGPGEKKSETSKGIEQNLSAMNNSKLKQSGKRKNAGVADAKVQSRKKGNTRNPGSVPGLSEVENLEQYTQAGEEQSDGKALSWNGSGRGRGRGRGVGVGRGKKKGNPGFESCDTTSTDSESYDHEQRLNVENSKGLQQSMRSRKPVTYYMKDTEIDDNDSFDLSNKISLNEEATEENLSSIHGACGDATTDFCLEKQSSMNNVSLKEDSSKPHLELGGGFCADESETSHPGTSSYDNFKVDSSTDYPKMGGGFCEDDRETENNYDNIHGDIADTVDEADNDKYNIDQSGSGIDRVGNELRDTGTACTYNLDPNRSHVDARSNHDHFDVSVLTPENAHNNTESSTGGLSAMPFLRKKRRKS